MASKSISHFKVNLKEAISTSKAALRDFDLKLPSQYKKNNLMSRSNVYSKHIHLSNLRYLFEYVIPTILDYGGLLKSNDYAGFRRSLLRLMRFYFTCEQKGIL